MWEFLAKGFMLGGGWSFVMLIASIVFYVFLILQFIKLKTKDYRYILWGLVFFLLIAGSHGTLVGLVQAGEAISSAPVEEQVGMFARAMSIATYTTIYALFPLGWAIIPLTIVTGKVANLKRA